MIKLSVQSNVLTGQPITIFWQATNIPNSGSIGFWIEHDTSRGERLGRTGTLTIDAIHTNGKNSGTFTWDGKSFGCAPEDAPKMCSDTLEPGHYILKANIYAATDVPLMYGPIAGYQEPVVLATSETYFTATVQ